jgi:hypothetical protein
MRLLLPLLFVEPLLFPPYRSLNIVSMESQYCWRCGVKLLIPTARFCPSGHSQTHESATKIKLENYDRHDDDIGNAYNEDGDDDDIQEVSGAAFLPSLRSQLSISTINRARSKAIQRDANQKALVELGT